MSTRFKVNGKTTVSRAEPDTPLLWVLREELGLTGTKFGCGVAQCGACTVHIDGVAARSCVMPVSAVEGKGVVTIEGVTSGADQAVAQRVVQAWVDVSVSQCGYCQPGQVMSAVALLKVTPKPTLQQVDDALAGNLCRCATYTRIREAVQVAAGAVKLQKRTTA
jgi:isoquinoline 1-oxidoreductase subunit alpha